MKKSLLLTLLKLMLINKHKKKVIKLLMKQLLNGYSGAEDVPHLHLHQSPSLRSLSVILSRLAFMHAVSRQLILHQIPGLTMDL